MRALLVSVAVLACAGAALAQGGWRRWNVRLRDGRLVVASPLSAPDARHVGTAPLAGGQPGRLLERAQIDSISLHPDDLAKAREPGTAAPARLPAMPTGVLEQDLLIRMDGRRSRGHVTFGRVAWSEGAVEQNGAIVDLKEVACIRFAGPNPARAAARGVRAPGMRAWQPTGRRHRNRPRANEHAHRERK